MRPPKKLGKITSMRHVYLSGVIGGTVHYQAVRGADGRDERTLCGNWPGREAAGSRDLCPVCVRKRVNP